MLFLIGNFTVLSDILTAPYPAKMRQKIKPGMEKSGLVPAIAQ
jgi:hypothetical protein